MKLFPNIRQIPIHPEVGLTNRAQSRQVVALLSNLWTLNISRYCLADQETDSFTDDEGLLVMLRGFPRLWQVGISLLSDYDETIESLVKYCKEREIDLYCAE